MNAHRTLCDRSLLYRMDVCVPNSFAEVSPISHHKTPVPSFFSFYVMDGVFILSSWKLFVHQDKDNSLSLLQYSWDKKNVS